MAAPVRQLHFADGIPTCCSSGARDSSAFVGRFEPVNGVSVVATAEKTGDDEGRTEAIAANAVKMRRRRESWECIL